MKTCYSCSIQKNLGEFHKDPSKKDGLHNKCKTCCKNYRDRNKEKNKKYQQKYRKENFNTIKTKRRKNQPINSKKRKDKIDNDPLFKLKAYLRNRIYSSLKNEKDKSSIELLGAPFKKVKEHLESTFQDGMTWENYGQWHVDHKIPLASSDTKEEAEKLCHYLNLQALWAEENLSKGSKL